MISRVSVGNSFTQPESQEPHQYQHFSAQEADVGLWRDIALTIEKQPQKITFKTQRHG